MRRLGAAVAGLFLALFPALAPVLAVEPNPLSIAAPDLIDGDGILNLVFDPWSSRLAGSEGVKLDRLAGLLSQKPGARLQILAVDAKDPAMQRFLTARVQVVEGELALRGYSAHRIRRERVSGIEQMVALRVVVPDPPPPPVRIPVETVSSPLPPIAAAGPQSILPAPTVSPPSPSPPPSAPAPVAVQEVWTATAGRRLKAVLEDWAQRAGWTLVWQSDRDYPLEAEASFTGDFTDAARQLVAALATVAPAPFANFYKGNRVLVVHTGEGR